MRILVIDPFSGVAGDMLVGGLLAAGADRRAVIRAMASVVAEPTIEIVNRAGISAVRVRTHAETVHRTLDDVLERMASADAPEAAIALAERIFRRLHAAEAEVHGDDRVHFHEVGADDAIADVLGASTALVSLGVDGVAVLPVPFGPGTFSGTHGDYPLPAPAAVALLASTGVEMSMDSDARGELVTPTGAACIAEMQTRQWRTLGPFAIVSSGYGAGTRDPSDRPNVLRALVVETNLFHGDHVEVLETNVDDVTGEVLAHTLSRVMDAGGARDVQALPALMKKGRMGYLIRVICLPEDAPRCAGMLAEELGTLGIRSSPFVHRFIADRWIEPVAATIGSETRSIDVKMGRLDGKIFTCKPEFEQVRRWANDLGLPLRTVARAVNEAAARGPTEDGRDER
jgi:uncharacterized protein (TIGR00299 family) protein